MLLLESATELVRKLPIRRLTTHEVAHLKLVNDFILELAWLGSCAIRKAEGERSH